MKNTASPSASRLIRALTVIQFLIASAIAIVLFAVGYPIYAMFQKRAHKQVAIERLRAFSGAMITYANQNDGFLPDEDAAGGDSWSGIEDPKAKTAWYNALPRLLAKKSAADLARSPDTFYTMENELFLPGANYPDKKKYHRPMFAFAMNTKLERNDAEGRKIRTRLAEVANPARTVAFLEQGLLNEDRTLQVQTRNDYDGSPKGSAKSFIGRYGGQGVLGFLDGHVELANPADHLTYTGDFHFPQSGVFWTPNPDDNPNKDATARERAKDK